MYQVELAIVGPEGDEATALVKEADDAEEVAQVADALTGCGVSVAIDLVEQPGPTHFQVGHSAAELRVTQQP